MIKLEIHNSDRVTFRRCRRKWDYQSQLRQSLVPISEPRGPLWLGSGFHFALEDFHGFNRFGDPRRAFDAYVDATAKNLPNDSAELIRLADGMLSYYVDLWLPKYHIWPTLWVDGNPQVEVDIELDITGDLPMWLIDKLYRKYDDEVQVVVKITFDKVEQDEYGRIWPVDYKTAKTMANQGQLEMNPQASQYFMIARVFYGPQVEGIVWQQHLKTLPAPPEPLKTGGLSMNKGQATTYSMYRAALIDMFGHVPKGYVEILNHFATLEDEYGDKYIRRDPLRRSEAHGEVEYRKLIAEATEMLDPDLAIYSNPTRDCTWDCPFKDASVMLDNGEDPSYFIMSEFTQFTGYDDSWRERITWPEQEEVHA